MRRKQYDTARGFTLILNSITAGFAQGIIQIRACPAAAFFDPACHPDFRNLFSPVLLRLAPFSFNFVTQSSFHIKLQAMNNEHDYLRDLEEIRSMMERSSKFLSLSGWAGIMAGIYALAGAVCVSALFGFDPKDAGLAGGAAEMPRVIATGALVLLLAIGTAVALSSRKAAQRGEKVWNAASRQLVVNMALPLSAGGILVVILLAKGFPGLAAPLTLIFYGLALFHAGKFTFGEVKFLGLIQTGLGLVAAWFVEYGLVLWALGFGCMHILYGTYMYFRYER